MCNVVYYIHVYFVFCSVFVLCSSFCRVLCISRIKAVTICVPTLRHIVTGVAGCSAPLVRLSPSKI